MKIFEIETQKIILGEAIAALENYIPDNSIDLIVADPPYNIGKKFNGKREKWQSEEDYLNWCYRWLSLCVNKLTKTGSIYIMAATQFMPYIDLYLLSLIHI